jgi:hypothetical protein
MNRKRAPGAGRKPRGEFRGKSSTLTTRITLSTRVALDNAARKSRRSLSQEVEARLSLSLRKRDHPKRIRGLGEAIMLLARCVERATDKAWNEDAFTGEAVRRGAEFLISHFAPRGTEVTPESVAKAVKRGAPQTYADSRGLGESEAGQVISWIESWSFHSLEEIIRSHRSALLMPGVRAHVPEEWYLRAQLLRDLGSGLKRQRAIEKFR